MTQELSLRAVTSEEFADYERSAGTAFGQVLSDADVPRRAAVFEPGRSLAFFDRDLVVATSGAYSTALRIPGGDTPAGVLTTVSVSRGYRRRGLLSRMMRRLHDEARERGEFLSALFASESSIYGRFGYGIATEERDTVIDRHASAFRADLQGALGGVATGGTVRPVDLATARALFPPVYGRARQTCLAMPARTAAWWDYQVLADPEGERHGAGVKDYAVHTDPEGRPDGYAVSRLKPGWGTTGPDGTMEITELVSTTPAAAAALWRYCLDTDLSARTVAHRRPAGDALPHLLADPRRARRTLVDGLWLRLVDVPAALEARAWDGSGRLLLSVGDAFEPANQGTWSLEVEQGKARCTRADGPADLDVDAEVLAMLYLGTTRPGPLAAAGRLRERTAGAAGRLAALLGEPEPAWAPEVF